jgi:hypothetical protein
MPLWKHGTGRRLIGLDARFAEERRGLTCSGGLDSTGRGQGRSCSSGQGPHRPQKWMSFGSGAASPIGGCSKYCPQPQVARNSRSRSTLPCAHPRCSGQNRLWRDRSECSNTPSYPGSTPSSTPLTRLTSRGSPLRQEEWVSWSQVPSVSDYDGMCTILRNLQDSTVPTEMRRN